MDRSAQVLRSRSIDLAEAANGDSVRIRCFIAMAFGEEDTDQLFEGAILSVLRSLGVEAVRVDRIEHNRNINDVIVEQLRNADFAIADLTYARPSVYFEAGYAERQVAVVYTVRADHVRAGARGVESRSDTVHFDVSMRNIIPWRHPHDSRFEKRLLSRLRSVIRPIVRAKKEEAKLDRARKDFAKLSAADQLKRLGTIAATVLVKEGFDRSPSAKKGNLPQWDVFFDMHRESAKNDFKYGARLEKGRLRLVAVLAAHGLTTREIRLQVRRWNLSSVGLTAHPKLVPGNFAVEATLVLCSPGPLRTANIKTMLFSAGQEEHSDVLAWTLRDDHNVTYRLALVGSIRSEPELAERLTSILAPPAGSPARS